MAMFMLVMLGEIQPDADRHEGSRDQQSDRDGFSEREHGRNRAEERRSREIGRRARCTQVPKRDNKQR